MAQEQPQKVSKKENKKYNKNPKQKLKQFERMKNLSIDMKNCLIKGELENFSKLMDKSWYLKTINPMATNKKIDKVYDLAKEAGAAGENTGSWTKWVPSLIYWIF